jgi:hypothetical protein
MPLNPALARDRARRQAHTLAEHPFNERYAPAATEPSVSEVVDLIKAYILLKEKNQKRMREGLDTLSPRTAVEFLQDLIAATKETEGDFGQRDLTGRGIVDMVESNWTDADKLGAALSDSLRHDDPEKLRIAQDLSRRRGIPLADALKAVPTFR